jgi:hypothetical protein
VPEHPTYLPGGPPQHRQAAILAYFADEGDAARAEADLQRAGYSARRDRVRGGAAGAGLDLAEGLTGGLRPPAPILVAVAVAGGRYEPALSIVRRHGGRLAP